MQYCRDLLGGAGVQCGCADGYKLDADGHSCSKTGNTHRTHVTNITTAHSTTVTTVAYYSCLSAYVTLILFYIIVFIFGLLIQIHRTAAAGSRD